MRRLLVLAALALAAALPSAAPAGPAAFMTFWVQWDMAFSGHSQVQTGAGA